MPIESAPIVTTNSMELENSTFWQLVKKQLPIVLCMGRGEGQSKKISISQYMKSHNIIKDTVLA